MAPSQMEYQDENSLQEYTHKKFNCGYAHKKFGSRIARRDSQESLNSDSSSMDGQSFMQQETKSSSSVKLFRPYALGDNTPRKRKQKQMSEQIQSTASRNLHYFNAAQQQQQAQQRISPTSITSSNSNSLTPPTAASAAFSLNKQTFAIMLQKQRAALYMSHLLKFNGNGNGWPTLLQNNQMS